MSKVIAIDFDGTIVEHTNNFPEMGDPIPGAFEWIKKFREAGAVLVLYTMRSSKGNYPNALKDAKEILEANGIKFQFTNWFPQDWSGSRKVYADIYIDDAAFGCPLIPGKVRPMVDWSIVGPQVLERISYKKDNQLELEFMNNE
jgi:hypothetical protein